MHREYPGSRFRVKRMKIEHFRAGTAPQKERCGVYIAYFPLLARGSRGGFFQLPGFCKLSITVMMVVACLFMPSVVRAATAPDKPVLSFQDGRITVKASGTPLLQLLKEVSKTTGVEIAVAEKLRPGLINADIDNKPLEDALKSLLKGYNYAAIYSKKGSAWQLTSLKIYPGGTFTGKVVPVLPETARIKKADRGKLFKTVMVGSGEEFVTYGNLQSRGILIPSQTVPGDAYQGPESGISPIFFLQKDLERKEAQHYQELMLLREKIASAKDPEKRLALLQVYADEANKFKEMKASHINRIEALKRIARFREMTGK